jgi:uncharacterized protein YcbK (DUF882 family)
MRGHIARSKRLFGGRKQRAASNICERSGRNKTLRFAACLATAAVVLIAATAGTQDAVANGETRSLTFFHTHTRESTTITFRRNGQYDSQALAQLNWFLRDWRVEKPAKMDPRLFDILWEVYREAGSSQPIHIVSAYRSPETNGALRRRSSGVSENSLHMQGKAMDIRLPDVDTARVRAIAMKMQYGGVGYYNSSDFVHVDTGGVRAWPRMSQEQLARLFPDGKTLHLPSNGKPLPGYELAKAEILARNAALAAQASAGGGPSIGGLFANIFGRKAPAQAPQQVANAAPTALPPAISETVLPASTPVPLPPQRPQEAVVVASADANVPAALTQEDTITTASLPRSGGLSEPVSTLGLDAKAAARMLFDPRSTFLDVGFSTHKDELSTTHFTGPAVKPLPLVRQAQASL